MIKLNVDQEKILYNFVNSFLENQIREVIHNDRDFKFTSKEYDEVFQCIYGQLHKNLYTLCDMEEQ